MQTAASILDDRPPTGAALEEAHALRRAGRAHDAVGVYERALAGGCDDAGAWNGFAISLAECGRLGEAEQAWRRCCVLAPDAAQAHYNLGRALLAQGLATEASASLALAATLAPANPEILVMLAQAHDLLGGHQQAVECWRRIVELAPQAAIAHHGLGAALHRAGLSDEAIPCWQRALALDPQMAESAYALGAAHWNVLDLDAVLGYLRIAVRQRPDNSQWHAMLISALHYADDATPQQVFHEQQQWAMRLENRVAAARRPHANARNPQRRLRIGYVSADFRTHPVGRCMEPVLAHHDRGQFEVFCYSDISQGDTLTNRLSRVADGWRVTAGMEDAALAELVRADGIDVLVDLAGHTTGNRLEVFARKPAPVQVSHIGQTSTTALAAIDYLVTTAGFHPPGMEPTYCTERLVRLSSLYAWPVPICKAEVNGLPARDAGNITFLCTNNVGKISHATVRVWARLLQALPQSRLLVRVGEGAPRSALLRRFSAGRMPLDRVELVPLEPYEHYLNVYHRADISLDPFPYNGYATTHESLWMGAPVVSLASRGLGPSRYGLGLLGAVGLDDLVAWSEEEYVRIALALAHDLPRLTQMRTTLRERVRASVLMDQSLNIRELESAYREMWLRHCAS